MTLIALENHFTVSETIFQAVVYHRNAASVEMTTRSNFHVCTTKSSDRNRSETTVTLSTRGKENHHQRQGTGINCTQWVFFEVF